MKNLRHLLFQLGLLGAVLLARPAAVQAQDQFYTNSFGIWGYTTNNDGTINIGYLYGNPGNAVTVPNAINGQTVSSLASWYYANDVGIFPGNITNVTIPNSVTSIGGAAFEGCTHLTGITIPNSVTSLGDYSFSQSGLTSITIPGSVTNLVGAFWGCDDLRSVTMDNGVPSIGASAFYNCTNLTSITLPNSITMIGDGAFEDCTSLTGITLPNSLTTIGYTAFFDCCGLTSLTIHDNVTVIGYEAFQGCTSLTNVTIPNSVTNLGQNAFVSCTSLISVYFGGNAPAISAEPGEVFAYDPKATAYYLPGTTGWSSTYEGIPAVLLNASTGSTNLVTLKTLHSFTNGSDGSYPDAGLISAGNTLYGTTLGSGYLTYGSVFAVKTDGTAFTTLYTFTNGSDGDAPQAVLVLSGKTLYGTAYFGGSGDSGTVFAVNTNGTGFTVLHAFTVRSSGTNSDGAGPGGITLSGGTLYGTAADGGASGRGTVFAVNTDGTGFKTLHTFTDGSDGSDPVGAVAVAGNRLYGTAAGDYSTTHGTVFAMNTDGTGFTTLCTFTNGSDGAAPESLMLSGGTLYGTASRGGSAGSGTLFALSTNGTGFTTLHTFTNGSDGATPRPELSLSGGTLYGDTLGASNTIFSVKTDGSDFTTLYTFTAPDPNSGTNITMLSVDAIFFSVRMPLCNGMKNFGNAAPTSSLNFSNPLWRSLGGASVARGPRFMCKAC